jgi:hypothetical protein
MGFNKKYITKEGILSNMKDIKRYLKADALLMDDEWSVKFINDLDYNERQLRTKMKREITSGCPDKHKDYSKLKSLSETLISLMTNPSWLDIHFTQEKLGRFQMEIHEFGNLDILKDKAIKSIIEYYELSN